MKVKKLDGASKVTDYAKAINILMFLFENSRYSRKLLDGFLV